MPLVAATVVAGLLVAIPGATGGSTVASSIAQESATAARGGITVVGARMATPRPVRFLGSWECDSTTTRVRCRSFGRRGRFVTSALVVVQRTGVARASVRARLPG